MPSETFFKGFMDLDVAAMKHHIWAAKKEAHLLRLSSCCGAAAQCEQDEIVGVCGECQEHCDYEEEE